MFGKKRQIHKPLDSKIVARLSACYMGAMGYTDPNPPESLLIGLMEAFVLAKPSEKCSVCGSKAYLCDTPGTKQIGKPGTCVICPECTKVVFNKT